MGIFQDRMKSVGMLAMLGVFLAFLVVSPVNGRLPYNSITARLEENQIGYRIEAELVFDTDPWYVEFEKLLNLDVYVELPENTTLEITLNRIQIFLEFYDDGHYLYYAVDTVLGDTATYGEDATIFSAEYSILVNTTELNEHFIVDSYNPAWIGFCLNFNSTFGDVSRSGINLYSHEPEGLDYGSPQPRVYATEDIVVVEVYWDVFRIVSYAMIAIVAAMILVPPVIKCVRSFRKKRPSGYVDKQIEIGGRRYDLGGIRTAMLYNLIFDLPPELGSPYVAAMQEWAWRTHGKEIDNELHLSSEYPPESQVEWRKIERAINHNAARLVRYLIDRVPLGKRATEYLDIAESQSIELDPRTTSYVLRNMEGIIDEQQRRWENGDEGSKQEIQLEEFQDTIARWVDELPPDLDDEDKLAYVIIAVSRLKTKLLELAREKGLPEYEVFALQEEAQNLIGIDALKELVPQIRDALLETELGENVADFYQPDPVLLESLFDEVRNADSTSEKGETMESFCYHLFKSVRGFSVEKNVRASTGEVDLIVSNNHTQIRPLEDWGKRILVEAKNWGRRVGVSVIEQIESDLDKYESKLAILVTRLGITGSSGSDARRLITKIYDRKRKEIVVFDEDDISSILGDTNLIDLIREKRTALLLS